MRTAGQLSVIVSVMSFISAMAASGQEPSPALPDPWSLSLRVGGEYSDNRDGTSTNKQSNFDVIVEPQAVLRYQDADRTAAQLMLMPMMKWRSNPRTEAEGGAQKDAELFGAVEAGGMHRLTPTVTLTAGDRLTYNDDPNTIQNAATARRSESYVLNAARAGVAKEFSAEAGFGLTGVGETTRYQDSKAAKELDSDLFAGELNTHYIVGSSWTLLGLISASEYQAQETVRMRGSAVETYNAGFEKKITQDLVGKIMGGLQVMQYDNPELDPARGMNGNAELTFKAAAPTRFRLAVEYGYTPPSDSAYSAQQATTFTGEIDHDVMSDRLTLRFLGEYMDSQYVSEGPDAPGGAETKVRLSAHGTYFLTHNCSLAGGYAYEKWDSAFREAFTRNMVDLSVRAEW